MSDPRHKHQFIPSRKGTCKMYVGGAICKLGEDALVHKRYEEDMSENTEKSREQIGEELARKIISWGSSMNEEQQEELVILARQYLKLKEEGR